MYFLPKYLAVVAMKLQSVMGEGRVHNIPNFRTNIMLESFQIVQQSTSPAEHKPRINPIIKAN